MAMAVHQPRSAGDNINLDVVQVPRDRQIAYPGRPRDPPVYRVGDIVDPQVLDRFKFRAGGDRGLPDPGQLDVVGQQPVRHVPLPLLISRRIRPGRLAGQWQVHVRVQVHPQRHWRLAGVTPGDDRPAGDRVVLPGLAHPGPAEARPPRPRLPAWG
jgi:hypothetical protein